MSRSLPILLTLCLGMHSLSAAPSLETFHAAGPRSGPVVALDVQVPTREALERLYSGGFDIDDVRHGVASVYATKEEVTRLEALGLAFSESEEEAEAARAKDLGTYHNYTRLTEQLQAYAAAYPHITRLFSIGRSVQGRELWVLLITDHPDREEDEPEFKYVATIHGNEPIGTELVLYLVEKLLTGYGVDDRITTLVDETSISVLPMMNPDGNTLVSRYNARGYDLNRSFPVYSQDFTGTIFDGIPLGTQGRPVEVARVMEWIADHSFVLSANLHSGALLVNYPYDDDQKGAQVPAPTPDQNLFYDISLRYSMHNLPMYNEPDDPDSPDAPDGVTNGAAWYVIEGGMQDWNYRYAACNEVTIELSTTKWPAASQLPTLWQDNEESMMAYMESVHIGTRGLVTNSVTGAPVYARIMVAGNAQPVFTDPDVGDYHRMLLPGVYTLTVDAPGYVSTTLHNVVVNDGPATRVDVALQPIPAGPADVNQDGRLDAVDIQLVVNGALGLPVPPTCDIDGNGITATDIQLVVNAVLAA